MKHYNHKIEGEALALAAGISSGNIAKTRATLNQLKLLLGLTGGAGSHSGQIKAAIASAIAQAQQHIAELEAGEHNEAPMDVQEKFEISIVVLMSPKAQNFYHAINADTHYTIAPVGEDGELITNATRQVHGKTLRRRLSVLKFHSLDTAHKKKVLSDTFGAEEAEGEGTPKNQAQLEKKKKELAALHEALTDMEAYKAQMISRKLESQPETAAAAIEKNHAIILDAHDQVNEVLQKYDALIENIHDNHAMAKLKAAKLKMKKILKDEVIDEVLLDMKPQTSTITGGIGQDFPLCPVSGGGPGRRSVKLFPGCFATL